jgi:hypothetical protein
LEHPREFSSVNSSSASASTEINALFIPCKNEWLNLHTLRTSHHGHQGRLTPKELTELYMSTVDCHLIHGCKISPDCEDGHVKHLSKDPVRFMHQMLTLHPRSMIAPLFTETGIMPLGVRRFQLVLKHLIYFFRLKKKNRLCSRGPK